MTALSSQAYNCKADNLNADFVVYPAQSQIGTVNNKITTQYGIFEFPAFQVSVLCNIIPYFAQYCVCELHDTVCDSYCPAEAP